MLIFDPRELSLHTEPEAHRLTDEEVEARTKTPVTLRIPALGAVVGSGTPTPRLGEYTPAFAFHGSAQWSHSLRNQVNMQVF